MIPLIPTLSLAFLSFIASAFVILRILIPILPPHPLSRRVSPAEFGLPRFRSLSPADKAHLWLASFDLLALALFTWQAVMEFFGSPSGFDIASDVGSSLRMWFAMTIRQTFLLVVASITLLHVRLGRSVSFGPSHWVLWAPTLLLATTSTALAGVLTGAGIRSFFIGLIAYSFTVAVLSSSAFCCLIGTLVIIRRNLASLNDTEDWPPLKEMERPRPSFATEEIDALRDGSSWITSNASSRRGSVSGWSFSTHQTRSTHSHVNYAKGSHPSTIPPKSSFWFNPATPQNHAAVPPVPPLPSPYRHSATTVGLDDPDPFRRDVPGLPQRSRMGSQSSWLTSPSASQVTLSQWSYPTSHADASTPDLLPSTVVARPMTPAMANAQVLGGYGYSPQKNDSEQALASFAACSESEIDVSVYRAIGWLLAIWVPFGFTLPYLFVLSLRTGISSDFVSILLILSVTLSSPILALNILFRSPIPIPQGLFDTHDESPSQVIRAASPSTTSIAPSFAHEYKRSGSVTVVESRRSTDVWISKGEAVDGKSKLSRAMSMLAPSPKLSILPPEETEDGETTPPLPIQRLEETPAPCSVPQTPHSETSAELGKIKKTYSGPGIHLPDAEENLGYQSKIMVAQRHYSAIAQTMVVPASPEQQLTPHNRLSSSTAIASRRDSSRPTSHIRTRSNSSVAGVYAPSPPPPFPLPPTPPSVKASKLAKLGHRKSYSSGFSFGAIDNTNEIDALSAGVLPVLIPGLKVGKGIHVRKDWDFSPPEMLNEETGDAKEFGRLMDDEFDSPELHSTPVKKGVIRPRKTSTHKRNHFSLPSLGLGKEGAHSLASWKAEVSRALEKKAIASEDTEQRNTIWEFAPTAVSHLNVVCEEDEAAGVSLRRDTSTRSRGLRADVPNRVESVRNSVTTLLSELQSANQPHSAASSATLFDLDKDCGPQAQSTPHCQKTSPLSISKQRHPRPSMHDTIPHNRRSSIVYIKSDSDVATTTPRPNPTPTSSTRSFSQWSSRAVRPLIPKASKLQRKMSDTKSGSPGGALRQLSLLQDRDSNTVETSPGGTRPLLLGKKQLKIKDENAVLGSAARSRGLKPLQLARSETSKLRGILRKDEVLPNVVVRPPSTTEHNGFAYNFR